MEKLISILEFINGKPWYIKILVLVLCGVIIYFTSGCAYKFHADNIDNVTKEIYISKDYLNK